MDIEAKHQAESEDRLEQDVHTTTPVWLTSVFEELLTVVFEPGITLNQAAVEIQSLLWWAGTDNDTRNPLTVAQLAVKMGRSRSTVQKAIDRLITQGHLKQRADAEDGRERPIYITAKGMERAQLLTDSAAAWRTGFTREHFDFLRFEDATSIRMKKFDKSSLRNFLDEVSPAVMAAMRRHLR